ncbi:MAG: phage portal protein [Gammaproteobacteria bacterium]|nr:phage portal protein [Gammaproteobacteria bacterium]
MGDVMADRRTVSFTLGGAIPSEVQKHLIQVSHSQVAVTYATVMGIPAFWRGISLIENAMVNLPFAVHMTTSDGKEEPAPDHPFQALIDGGVHEDLDASGFVRLTAHQVKTYGAAHWGIEYDGGGNLTGLRPIEPATVRPVMRGGERRYTGTYISFDSQSYELFDLPADDVLIIQGLSRTGVVGLSPIQICADALGLAISAPRYAAGLFANGGIPLLVVLFDDDVYLDERGRLEFEEKWEKKTRGVKGAGGVRDVKMLGLRPDESQLLGTREENVREIGRILDVPPSMLFETSRSTYNNASEEGRAFANNCIIPLGTRIVSGINHRVVEPPYFVKFTYDRLLVPPMKDRFEAYEIGLEKGFMLINQVRQQEGWPDLEGEELEMAMQVLMNGKRKRNDAPGDGDGANGDDA